MPQGWGRQTVYLSNFASYIPESYTDERFLGEELDYKTPRLPIAVWGEDGNVAMCIGIHNEIIRDIAKSHSHVHLLDIENAIPSKGLLHDDVCHFSNLGRAYFFGAIASGLANKK